MKSDLSALVRQTLRNQRGVAAIEFALTAPLMLLIVFATIEYGWYLTHCIVASNAVADGARAAVKAREWETDTHAAEDPVVFAREALEDSLWIHPGLENSHIAIRVLPADEKKPRRVTVAVIDAPYRPVTGYLGRTMLPATYAAKSVMAFP